MGLEARGSHGIQLGKGPGAGPSSCALLPPPPPPAASVGSEPAVLAPPLGAALSCVCLELVDISRNLSYIRPCLRACSARKHAGVSAEGSSEGRGFLCPVLPLSAQTRFTHRHPSTCRARAALRGPCAMLGRCPAGAHRPTQPPPSPCCSPAALQVGPSPRRRPAPGQAPERWNWIKQKLSSTELAMDGKGMEVAPKLN